MIKLAKIPNLTELTYRSIKQNLLDGTLGELSRLTEESLATQLGISKSPVREALNRLDAEVRPGKPSRWKQNEDILGWLDSL